MTGNLPVLVQELPGSASVTILILFQAGSRFETQDNSGVAHFLEHMFFKGGKDFENALDVSMAIDGIGGVHNAFTSKEVVGYYVKLASDKLEHGMHVLSDMLQYAPFSPEEIEKEKGVIIEELRMYQDMPQYLVERDFERLVYGDHPLGWEIGGTEQHVEQMQQHHFLDYRQALYTPDNMVISVAGGVSKKDVTQLVAKYFTQLSGFKQRAYVPWEPKEHASVVVRTKQTDQAHCIFGVRGVPRKHPLRYAMSLLAIMLGGNSSSRMFQKLREEEGLCYYVSASHDTYDDTGMFTMRAGVNVTKIDLALDAMQEMFDFLLREGVDEQELARAKEFWKGQLCLSLEDSEELAYFHGVRYLFGQERDLQAVYRQVDGVTLQDIQDACSLLSPSKLSLAVIGPYEQSQFLRFA